MRHGKPVPVPPSPCRQCGRRPGVNPYHGYGGWVSFARSHWADPTPDNPTGVTHETGSLCPGCAVAPKQEQDTLAESNRIARRLAAQEE
jgi:hypothetical protein